jgi:hypothetical protein
MSPLAMKTSWSTSVSTDARASAAAISVNGESLKYAFTKRQSKTSLCMPPFFLTQKGVILPRLRLDPRRMPHTEHICKNFRYSERFVRIFLSK